MKKTVIFIAALMLLLTACNKGEYKHVSKSSAKHSNTSIS